MTVNAGAELGIRAYARHQGVAPSAVEKAIHNGRLERSIRRTPRGPRINVALADQEWRDNKNTSKVRDNSQPKPTPPPDPALPLLRAGDALLDLAERIEVRLEAASHETARRKPTTATVKVWRALYKTWGEIVPALEEMQRQARAAVPALRATS